ncbi:MAG: Maf family protein [Pseudomonadota bacterium]
MALNKVSPTTAPVIVLASASPRRSALLTQIGVRHAVRATDVDESRLPGELPHVLVRRLAVAKAIEGRRQNGTHLPVLAADTIVVLDGVVFGKPRDKTDSLRMLQALGGRTHHVMTAVALAMPAFSGDVTAAPAEALSDTTVSMRPITAAEAEAYWASGEPVGKAGSYAIQGLGARFIAHIEGSYSGVMGLPLYETAQLLQAHGLHATYAEFG